MAINVRELPPAEFERLAEIEPFKTYGVPSSETTRCVVVEDNGVIVGYWPIWNAVHAEPLWLDEGYRNSPTIGRKMLEEAHVILKQHGVKSLFAVIGHKDILVNGPVAKKLGFERMSGDLYMMTIPPEEV
mgnify:CR=1